MSLVIDLVVLVLLIRNQVRAKPLSGYTLPLVLLALGVVEFGSFLVGGDQQLKETVKGQRSFALTVHDDKTVAVALIGSLVIAALAAAIRASTFRLWWQDGNHWRQGTAVTVVVWIVSLGAHLLYGAIVGRDAALSGLGGATALLYFGVSLLIQRLLLAARATRIPRGDASSSPPPAGGGR